MALRRNQFAHPRLAIGSARIFLKRGLLPGLILAWFILLIYLPYFRISNVSYQGLKIIKQTEIEQVVNDNFLRKHSWWPSNNFFLVTEGDIATFLQKKFLLNNIVVKKVFPNNLTIQLEEKISSIIYCDGRQYFLLDQQGTVMRVLKMVDSDEISSILVAANKAVAATPTTTVPTGPSSPIAPSVSGELLLTINHPNYFSLKKEFGDYPVVYDLRQGSTTTVIGSDALRPELVKGIMAIYQGLRQTQLGIANYFIIDRIMSGVTVKLNEPWKVVIDPDHDLPKQFNDIKLVLKSNQPAEYIDVRFGDRVYWK